jgi:hypothetical protein
MIVKVSNPTAKAKAILVEGGHAMVGPGESVEIDVTFGKEKAAQYEAAGLVFSTVKETSDDVVKGGKTATVAPTAPVISPTSTTPPATPPVAPVVASTPPKGKKD